MISKDFQDTFLEVAGICYSGSCPYEDVVLIAIEEHFNAIVAPRIRRYDELEILSIIVKDNDKDEVQEIVKEHMPPWCTVNVYSDNREYLANLEQRIQHNRSNLKDY